MRVILNSYEVGTILSGNWTRPGPKITKSSEKESDEEAKQHWQQANSAWSKADIKCQKLIVTSVDDRPLEYLMNCETSVEMWEKLLSIYEQK